MNFASSGLIGIVAQITNATAAQEAASVITPAINPVTNQYSMVGTTSGASGSLAVPQQGNNANPCGRMADAIPWGLVNLQNEAAVQASSTYRI